jgi:hypothetical protein
MFLRIYSKLMNSASVGCRCGRHRGVWKRLRGASAGGMMPRCLEAASGSRCGRYRGTRPGRRRLNAASGSGRGRRQERDLESDMESGIDRRVMTARFQEARE